MLPKIALAACGCLLAGTIHAEPLFQSLPTDSPVDGCNLPVMGEKFILNEACVSKTPALREALVDLAVYLQTTDPSRLAAPSYAGPLDIGKLQRTVSQLIHWLDSPPGAIAPINEQFDFYALGDPDTKRPVRYGGYFTPVLDVSASPTADFRYPVYQKPAGEAPLPSRQEIMQGALKGKGLEIAWTNNPIDYYFMQVQGSGMIRYPDGHTQLLGFAGKNAYPYASIGKYMQQKGYLRTDNLSNTAVHEWLKLNPNKLDEVLNANQSFVFFKPVKGELRSASGLPVIAGHTASVDTSVIPFGSILLAELPLRDNKGKIVQHEWRLLLATDRRSDDRGVVSIGIYTGEGEQARAEAQHFFPAGRAFILQSGS